MKLNPVYLLQRTMIARKMHLQANKIYLHHSSHPYFRDVYQLDKQYIYRLTELQEMLDEAARNKHIPEETINRLLLEVATNPGAQIKLQYSELIDIKAFLLDGKQTEGPVAAQHAKAMHTCLYGLKARLPDVIPTPESYAEQYGAMHNVLDWMFEECTFDIPTIIEHIKELDSDNMLNYYWKSANEKAPRTNDYIFYTNAVIFSSLRALRINSDYYTPEDRDLVYWCCLYLRYCAPGLMLPATQRDAFNKVRRVLCILRNEWIYLLNKYPVGGTTNDT